MGAAPVKFATFECYGTLAVDAEAQ